MIGHRMEKTNAIINRLFDPRKKYSKCSIDRKIKYGYLKRYLEENWEDICGVGLAKNCCVESIEDSKLYVIAASSPLANELKMMEPLFLKKVNHCLENKIIIKKIHFHVGRMFRRKKSCSAAAEAEKKFLKKAVCPLCGSAMYADSDICSICERRLKEEESRLLAELIKEEPWISYEECRKYRDFDRMLFSEVQGKLKHNLFGRVKKKEANADECLTAVMLLLGKKPEDIDDRQYENALEYLRRN